MWKIIEFHLGKSQKGNIQYQFMLSHPPQQAPGWRIIHFFIAEHYIGKEVCYVI